MSETVSKSFSDDVYFIIFSLISFFLLSKTKTIIKYENAQNVI